MPDPQTHATVLTPPGLTPLSPCDILLYKGSGLSSRIIQWGTGSLYSHVAVVANPQMTLAIESNTGHQAGVRAIDLRKLNKKNIDVYRIKKEGVYEKEKVISYLVSRLGAPYDWPGVIWLGVMKAASALTGFKVLRGYNEFQKQKDYFCSELIYEAFAVAGLDIVPQIGEADITSPGDIASSPLIEKIAVPALPEVVP